VGSQRASGVLLDGSGAAIGGASIQISLTPVDGPGTLDTYSISGSVPPGATKAVVGLRMNTECGCAGSGDVSLYEASYEEAGASTSLVPDGDFTQGLGGWGLYGTRPATLRPSDRGGGSMLVAKASPSQTSMVNSPEFAVHAGQQYTAEFQARVSPESDGSGYFTVVFLSSSKEISRARVPFVPATFDLGERTTDANGTFIATFHPPGAFLHIGRILVEAWYGGDDTYWPAYRSGTISV
jgi:hypothetical protein